MDITSVEPGIKIYKNLTVVFPDSHEEEVCVELEKKIGDLHEDMCRKNELSADDYGLMWRMTFLDVDMALEDLVIPDNARLQLVPDFRPQGPGAINVVLKVEGTLCSAFFRPDVSLWTVVKKLVASESLSGNDVTPIVIMDENEFAGVEVLNEIILSDVASGHRAIFRFKLLTKSKFAKKRSTTYMEERDSGSQTSEVFSIRTTGLESTSSISTVDDRFVFFKQAVELIEPPTEEDELLAEPRGRHTIATFHGRLCICCSIT